MHSISYGLPWFVKQGILPQTNFLILENFHQEIMVEDSNLLAIFDIKFSTQMWSINRLVYIIEARQFLLLKIGSRHWKNSARTTWNVWSVIFYSSRLIFMRQLKMDLSCLRMTYSYGFFFCLLDNKYSQLINHYGWPSFR